ncbi:MAG: hypothetical protein WAT79_12020 [Saprospiraceae bacterium]
MNINNKSTLFQIKTAFHEAFPFLKIEFYRHTHDAKTSSPKTDQIITDEKISDLTGKDVGVDILVVPTMKVEEFESLFYQSTGIGVQVFRNSNGVWLQTSATDSWTLEKQNGKGERSDVDYDINPVGITDFDVE